MRLILLVLLSAGLCACEEPADSPPRGRAQPEVRRAPSLPLLDVDRYSMSFAEYETSIHPLSAHMLRWRPLVRKVVGADEAARRDVALVMTFIFVESGGRQYAISRSGCIGLMQFCSRTAVRSPFGDIFGTAALRACDCATRRCRVHWNTRRFLEVASSPLHPLVAHEVPCALSDPRFDPERAIRAGWQYIQDLSQRFSRNPYLIYVGYNSGPHVAERVWKVLGQRRAEELSNIGKVLRRALTPNFGRAWARRRARSLERVHLPKVMETYRTYLREEGLAPPPSSKRVLRTPTRAARSARRRAR